MEYRVVIPKEVYAVLHSEKEGLPAVFVVNQALANFEPKVVFDWHLSIIVTCEEIGGNGMPTTAEQQVLDKLGDQFDKDLKANGNALFLARITWNGTRQFLYRVHDPEVTNAYLTSVIDGQAQTREFEFRMERDETWEYTKYWLSHWENESGTGN